MFNQKYYIDKDIIQKGALESLKRSVNLLEFSLERETTKYIPEIFTQISSFVDANKKSREVGINEIESPYFRDYADCINHVKELAKNKFGEDWEMAGEW